jgi:hypothetical protein
MLVLHGVVQAHEVRTIRADLPMAVTSGFIDDALRAGGRGGGAGIDFQGQHRERSVRGVCAAGTDGR